MSKRLFFPTFLFFIALALALQYWVVIRHGASYWITADWLINYQGGWVRRGLIGEIIYKFSTLTHASLKETAFVLQNIAYGAFLLCFYKLMSPLLRKSNYFYLFILSPAFPLLFYLYDFYGAFRKESLIFLSFSLLCLFLQSKKMTWLISSLAIYCLAVFSHEIAFFALPFYTYALFRYKEEFETMGTYTFIHFAYACIGFSGLVFALLFSGSYQTAAVVCSSLTTREFFAPNFCNGAILWLGKKSSDATLLISDSLSNYLRTYIPAAALTAMPFLYIRDWLKTNRLFLLFSGLAILPLFVIALDWGRFISIYFCLLTLYLCLEFSKNKIQVPKSVSFWFIFLYAAAWSMPHALPQHLGLGLYEFLKTLIWRSLLQ